MKDGKLLDNGNSVEISEPTAPTDSMQVAGDNSVADGDGLMDSESEISFTDFTPIDGHDVDGCVDGKAVQPSSGLPETSADDRKKSLDERSELENSAENNESTNDHRSSKDGELMSDGSGTEADGLLEDQSSEQDSISLQGASSNCNVCPGDVATVNDIGGTDGITDGSGQDYIDLTEVGTRAVLINNNINNNNIVICKAHKISSNAESEAPAVARWAALVGYAKTTVIVVIINFKYSNDTSWCWYLGFTASQVKPFSLINFACKNSIHNDCNTCCVKKNL